METGHVLNPEPGPCERTEESFRVGWISIIGIKSFAKILQRNLRIYLYHLCSVSQCLFLLTELYVSCRQAYMIKESRPSPLIELELSYSHQASPHIVLQGKHK